MFQWLRTHNSTYERYLKLQQAMRLNPPVDGRWWIRTEELLLHMPGVEVAIRPALYPRASYGDSDIKERLLKLGHITETQLPSIKTSHMHKLQSRCAAYYNDFKLLCLIYDIAMARAITAAAVASEKLGIAPEACCDNSQKFDVFWEQD